MQTVWQDADSRDNTCGDHRPSNRNDRSKTISQRGNDSGAVGNIGTAGLFLTPITFDTTQPTAQSVEVCVISSPGTTVTAFHQRRILRTVGRSAGPVMRILRLATVLAFE